MNAAIYVPSATMASVAREHLWRDVTGYLAWVAWTTLPPGFCFRFMMWALPHAGDWMERDARWEFAMRDALGLF